MRLIILDDVSLFLTEAITLFKTGVTYLDVRLIDFGLDPTLIVMRGPTLVIMGFAMSTVLQFAHGIQQYTTDRLANYAVAHAYMTFAPDRKTM